MSENGGIWSAEREKKLAWPVKEDGEPETPVLLEKSMSRMDFEMTRGLLNAFGIPTLEDLADPGILGKIILGFPGLGVDIYVPKGLYEDAKDVLKHGEYEENE